MSSLSFKAGMLVCSATMTLQQVKQDLYTQHHGISVHKAWPSIGLAPHSLTATPLDCDVQPVTMEFSSDEWHFLY